MCMGARRTRVGMCMFHVHVHRGRGAGVGMCMCMGARRTRVGAVAGSEGDGWDGWDGWDKGGGIEGVPWREAGGRERARARPSSADLGELEVRAAGRAAHVGATAARASCSAYAALAGVSGTMHRPRPVASTTWVPQPLVERSRGGGVAVFTLPLFTLAPAAWNAVSASTCGAVGPHNYSSPGEGSVRRGSVRRQ